MVVERQDHASLTDRARAAILQGIMGRQFHGRLPSEEALADMLDVSRTTIRSALQSLEQDGIVTRRRALGTTINAHVRPSTLALQRLLGFDGLLREQGHKVRVEVDWSEGEAPPDIAEGFPLAAGNDCVLAERSYFAGGELAVWIRDAVPRVNLKDDDIEQPPPASLLDLMANHGVNKVDHAVVDVVPMTQRGDGATKLDVGAYEPYTRLHETHYSSGGRPLAFSLVDVDSHFIAFQVFHRA